MGHDGVGGVFVFRAVAAGIVESDSVVFVELVVVT